MKTVIIPITALSIILCFMCRANSAVGADDEFATKLEYFEKYENITMSDTVRCNVNNDLLEFSTPNATFEYFFHASEKFDLIFKCKSTIRCGILISDKLTNDSKEAIIIQLFAKPNNYIAINKQTVERNEKFNGVSTVGYKTYRVFLNGNSIGIQLPGKNNDFIISYSTYYLKINYLSFISYGGDESNNMMMLSGATPVVGYEPKLIKKGVVSECTKVESNQKSINPELLNKIKLQYDYFQRINITYTNYLDIKNVRETKKDSWFLNRLEKYYKASAEIHLEIFRTVMNSIDADFIDENYSKPKVFARIQNLYEKFIVILFDKN